MGLLLLCIGHVVNFKTVFDKDNRANWFRLRPHLETLRYFFSGCDVAHIILSPEPFQDKHPDALEVIIDAIESTWIGIKQSDGTILAEKIFNDLTLCAVPLVELWLDWSGGVLSLGKGRPYGEKLLSWNSTQDTLPIEGLSFHAENNAERWEMDLDQGEILIIF